MTSPFYSPDRLRPRIISVLTPCYNAAEYLDEYFESLSQQTYTEFEIVFVNDGSTDRSAAIAERWKTVFENRGQRFVLITQSNQGAASAVNRGLEYVEGEYLTWPDSDDILHPDFFGTATDAFQLKPHVKIVRTYARRIAHDGRELGQIGRASTQLRNIFKELITERTYLTCGCYMVRTREFMECQGGRSIWHNTRAGQNWQMLLPIAYKYSVQDLAEAPYTYRVHASSHSHNPNNDGPRSQMERLLEHERILQQVVRRMRPSDLPSIEKIIRRKYDRMITRLLLGRGDPALVASYFQAQRQGTTLIELLRILHEKRLLPFLVTLYQGVRSLRALTLRNGKWTSLR